MLADEKLPNFSKVLADGRWSDIHAPEIGSASAWASFLTGRSGEDLRLVGEWIWDPATMSQARIPETLDDTFPERLHDKGLRVGLLDVPFTPEVEWPNGFVVSEWGAHYRLTGRLWSSPAEATDVVASVPSHPYSGVNLRPSDPSDLPRLKATAAGGVEGVKRRGELARLLFTRFPLDLAVVVFQEIHHSGHYLWHATEPDHPLYADIPHDAKDIGDPVRATLVETDRVFGSMLAQLQPSSVVLFSLNGMEPYRGTPDVLDRILKDRGYATLQRLTKKQALTAALRKHAPGWLREIYHRSTSREGQLERVRSNLTAPHDWARTRAFALAPEEWSPVEVNLRGREGEGVVETGTEYDRLVGELVALVEGLSTTDGRRAVRGVFRPGDPSSGWADLVVQWEHSATYPTGSLADAPAYEMHFPHHTGHHPPIGFCIAGGDIVPELQDDMTTEELHHPIATVVRAR